jgi:beta-fructofuranosidase
MTEREKELHAEAWKEAEKLKNTVEKDPYRQQYHLMPPSGLLNDPNGWIQWQGTYHLFFQWNPYRPDHQHKFWGHYTSADLVGWQLEPIALAPSEWYEKNGCYSGSSIDLNGKLALLYTGNVKDENNNRESYQCLAVSENGIDFEKKGPVVDELPEGYTAHFRDPKVWKENGSYYFVIGAQTENLEGEVLLYRSEDFHTWECLGPIAGAQRNGLGKFGYMWECPDYFRLGSTDVLIVSPQGLDREEMKYENTYQAGYFLGNADLQKVDFQHGEFHELDEGFEFYAPQTTEDEHGRRILIGWMGVPDSDEEYQPTVKEGWVHCMTIPRELHSDGTIITQSPVKELEELREGTPLEMRIALSFGAEAVVTPASEIILDTKEAGDFQLKLRDEAELSYNAADQILTLSRPRFRDGEKETRKCRVDRLEELRLYLDSSSLEVFINQGEKVMTARYFPEQHANTVKVSGADGSLTWKSWELKS